MNFATRKSVLFIALAIATSSGTPRSGAAETDMINADPSQIAAFLRSHDAAVRMDKDSVGDPMIRSQNPKESPYYSFNIYFYDCEDQKDCGSIQYQGIFTRTSVKVDLERVVAQWNAERRFGRAYLDPDGDPSIEMDVNISNGMSAELFEDNFKFWTSVLRQYADAIWPDENPKDEKATSNSVVVGNDAPTPSPK